MSATDDVAGICEIWTAESSEFSAKHLINDDNGFIIFVILKQE